ILVVMAQQAMSGRAGVASGILLGVGFVAGAIGVPVMGAVADATSMQFAMRLLTLVALAGVAIAFVLPSEQRLHEMAEERARASTAAVEATRQAQPQS
ncbi:MAG TPA: hypothetical protein VKU87_10880, partial [Thermomicrobiaceae bacterium]|nr:hypothetical protein [Thermomicrobiaceae bacterium]